MSFSAGPSFSPMYFIIMSLRSSSSAFPSISCWDEEMQCHQSWATQRRPSPH